MVRMALLILALLPPILCAANVGAAIYYVDKLLPGSDSNNGTAETTPFLTIQKCVNVIVARNTPGDTCLVKNGTYNESLNNNSNLRGNSSAYITLAAYPGHTPILDGTGLGQVGGINLHGPDTSLSATATNLLSYFALRGFEVRNFYYTALTFNNADHLVIEQNYFHDNGLVATTSNHGVLGTGIDILFQRNYIRHNGVNVAPYGHGMYIQGTRWKIVNNLIVGNTGVCIQHKSANVAAGFPSAEYAAFAFGLTANNTCAYSGRSGMNYYLPDAGSSIHDNRLSNNIFYENTQNSPGNCCNGLSAGGASTITVDHNVSYGTHGSTAFSDGNCSSCSYVSNCPSTVGGNCASNPNFVNAPSTLPASPDFHLTSGSIAINFGTDLSASFTTDYTGAIRTVPWDIGAYEYGSDTTPPAAPTNLTVQ